MVNIERSSDSRPKKMSEENFVGEVVDKLKKQGLFDRFRKECLSDVDTKPAYQNLQVRVKEAVGKYLHGVKWKSDLNKNQLRENLRRHLNDLPMLTNGIDRVVDQVVKPKILKSLKPQIDQVVCEHMGLNYEQWLMDQHDVQKKLEQHMSTTLNFSHPPLAIPLTTSASIATTSAPHLSSSSSSFPLIISDLKLPPPPPPASSNSVESEQVAASSEIFTSYQNATETTPVTPILSPAVSAVLPAVPFLHPDTSVPPPSLPSVIASSWSLVPAVPDLPPVTPTLPPVTPNLPPVTPTLPPITSALPPVLPNVPTMVPTLPPCPPALPQAMPPVPPALPLSASGLPALPPSIPAPPPDMPAPPPDPDFTQSLSPPPLPPDEEENVETPYEEYQQEPDSDNQHEPETCEMTNEKEVVFEEVTPDGSNFFNFQENQMSEEVTSTEIKSVVTRRNFELDNEKSNRSLLDTSRDTDDKSFDGNFQLPASHEEMSNRYNFAWNKVNESDLSNISVSSVHTSDLSSFEEEEEDEEDEDDDDNLKKLNPEEENQTIEKLKQDKKNENERPSNEFVTDSSFTGKKMTLASIKSQGNSMTNVLDSSGGKKRMKKEEMKERKMEEKRRRTLNRRYCSEEFTSIFTTNRNLLENKEDKKAITMETQAVIEEASASIMGSEDDSKQQMEVANDDSDDENVKSPYSDISEASSDSVVVVGVEPAKRKKNTSSSSKSKKSKSRKRSRSSDRIGGSGRKKKRSRRHRSGRRSSNHRSGRDSDDDGDGDNDCALGGDNLHMERDVYCLPVNDDGGEGSGGVSFSDRRKRSSRRKSSSSKSKDHDDFSRSSFNDEKMVNFGEAARQAAAFRMIGSSKQPATSVVAAWQKQSYGQVPRQTRPHSHHYLPTSNFLPPPSLAGHRQVPSSFPPLPVVRPPYHQGGLMTRLPHDSRRFSHIRNNKGQGYTEGKYAADIRDKYHGSRGPSRSVHSANLGHRNEDELVKSDSVDDGENRCKRRWVASDQPGDISGSHAAISKISRQHKNFRHDRLSQESGLAGGPSSSYQTNSEEESIDRTRSNPNRVEHERSSSSKRIRK